MPLELEKIPAVGVDYVVQKAQQKLFRFLLENFELEETDIKCYGRVYKYTAKNDSDTVPRAYAVAGNDYEDALFDDAYKCVTFFGLDDAISYLSNRREQRNAHLIVHCKADDMEPSIPHHPDEEVRRKLAEFCNFFGYGFRYKGMDTVPDQILNEYTGQADKIRRLSTAPYAIFRLNFDLTYSTEI
jgi:hypothetical protein